MLNAVLKVVGGKQDGKLIPLGTKKFLIGREHDCHLRPNSESVSRHHCVITIDDFAVRVRDLGSSNGTYLNGTRIIGAQPANSGDRLTVGGLEFELQYTGEPVAVGTDGKGGTEFSLDAMGLEDAEPLGETAVMSGDTAVIASKEELTEQPLSDETVTDAAQPAEPAPVAAEAAPEAQAEPDPVPADPAQPDPAQPDPAQQALAAQQAAAAQQQMMPQQPGYGMPQQPYPGMPQPGYGMPQPGYGMPQPGYGMPQPGYGMPQPGYGMPQPGYGMPQQMGYPQYPPQPQQPMGYPAAPQPQYAPVEEEDAEDEPDAASAAEPLTQLPDPAETGYKEPELSADETKEDGAPKPAAPNPAEEVLKKYMNRR